MGLVTIVTTWGMHQSDIMGVRWLEGATQWPAEWKIVVYGETPSPDTIHRWNRRGPLKFRSERRSQVDALAPANNLLYNGRVPQPFWRTSEHDAGYSFRTDMRRFAWKAFALLDALAREQGTVVWLDADVLTHQPPPADLWSDVALPPVAWLDRRPNHPDTGCMVFDTSCCCEFQREYANYYCGHKIFDLEQWHDAWVFWEIVKTQNWSPLWHSPRSNVWYDSPLAKYFSHEKGFKRKKMAYGSD